MLPRPSERIGLLPKYQKLLEARQKLALLRELPNPK